MERMKRVLGFVGVVAVAAVLAGCGATSDPTSKNSNSGSRGGPIKVGVTIHQADVYFQGVADAVKSAVDADGGKTTLVNTETNAATEASGLQNLLTAQVDGIVTSPLSPEGSLASIKAAHADGIPIICYNTCLSDADNTKYVQAFIESDQTDLGTQTGTYAAAYLTKLGKTSIVLGMLNCNRYEACKQRQDGFLAALKAGGITAKVVADQEALAPDEASKKATDILTANPNIDVFWSSSQGATEGMVAAVKATPNKDKISLFGTDVSDSLIQSIQSGDLIAITGQDSKKTGSLAVEFVKKAIAGDKISPFLTSIPGNLYSADDKPGLQAYLESTK